MLVDMKKCSNFQYLFSSLKSDFSVVVSHRKKCSSSLNGAIKKRNELYNSEVKRQKESVGRIEKITVQYRGIPKDEAFAMNKFISTPYHVAQHINQFIASKAALALVDSQKLWDMHRPLEADCSLNFLHFTDPEPHLANKAYWRSCCFLLGALAETCFKDNVQCLLHSFPSPNVKSGSFVYDVQLNLDDWKPTGDELRILSAEYVKLCRQHLPFHRLDVDAEVAEEIFRYNPFKSNQIPDIAMNSPGVWGMCTNDWMGPTLKKAAVEGPRWSNGFGAFGSQMLTTLHCNKVTLYRVGDHLDISRGPMINNTQQLGRTTITAVHKLTSDIENLYRFQGVSIPAEIRLNHFAYGVLEERASKLNPGRVPGLRDTSSPTFHLAESI